MNEMNGIRPLPLGVSRRSPIKGTEGGVMQRSFSVSPVGRDGSRVNAYKV
jgi:hypothetical protein